MKTPAIKIGDLILCEWEDSNGCSSNWQIIEPNLEPELMTCKSIGWVVRKNSHCIVVVPHISLNTAIAEQQGCGDMTIPTASIVRLRKLSDPFSCASPAPSQTQPRF